MYNPSKVHSRGVSRLSTIIMFPVRQLSLDTIVLGQEVGPFPIHDAAIRFLLRMNIEFIKGHYIFVLQIIQRPLICLTVGRNVSAQRRISGQKFPGSLFPPFSCRNDQYGPRRYDHGIPDQRIRIIPGLRYT